MPGASAAAHLAELESRRAARPVSRQQSVQEKAVVEGRDLTKHLVGILGKILADFGRFAVRRAVQASHTLKEAG